MVAPGGIVTWSLIRFSVYTPTGNVSEGSAEGVRSDASTTRGAVSGASANPDATPAPAMANRARADAAIGREMRIRGLSRACGAATPATLRPR